jgi:hypothetical protein
MEANLDEFGEANELNVSRRLLLLLLCIVISHIFLPSGCSLRCQKLRNKEMYKKEKERKNENRMRLTTTIIEVFRSNTDLSKINSFYKERKFLTYINKLYGEILSGRM